MYDSGNILYDEEFLKICNLDKDIYKTKLNWVLGLNNCNRIAVASGHWVIYKNKMGRMEKWCNSLEKGIWLN